MRNGKIHFAQFPIVNKKGGHTRENPISSADLCGLAPCAILCRRPAGLIRRSALYRMDDCLSADGLVFLRKKISSRRKKVRSLHAFSFIPARPLLFHLLHHARRRFDGAAPACLVRALGAHRSDPQAKDPLLLKINTNIRKKT